MCTVNVATIDASFGIISITYWQKAVIILNTDTLKHTPLPLLVWPGVGVQSQLWVENTIHKVPIAASTK